MNGPPPGYMPPPPPPPPEGFQPPKPTSGKAVAALVCGVAGPLAGFFCPLLGVAVLVGLVLGVIALLETGKGGSRSGRGLAIAGTVLSGLSLVATAGVIVYFIGTYGRMEKEVTEYQRDQLARDSELIVSRVVRYCRENNDDLGPGGPILAGPGGDESASADDAGRVGGRLQLDHLVHPDELRWRRGGGNGWELRVTGRVTATLTATGWGGETIWQVEIRDASKSRTIQTVP